MCNSNGGSFLFSSAVYYLSAILPYNWDPVKADLICYLSGSLEEGLRRGISDVVLMWPGVWSAGRRLSEAQNLAGVGKKVRSVVHRIGGQCRRSFCERWAAQQRFPFSNPAGSRGWAYLRGVKAKPDQGKV